MLNCFINFLLVILMEKILYILENFTKVLKSIKIFDFLVVFYYVEGDFIDAAEECMYFFLIKVKF